MKIYLSILAAAFMCAGYANEVMEITQTTDFLKSKNLSVENGTFSFTGNRSFHSAKQITVDPAKKYKISALIQAQGKIPLIYLGYVPLDANNKQIMPENVNDVADTMTTLAAPVKKGDKTVVLTDGSKWNAKIPHASIAFGADADFKDLPNFDVLAIEKNGISQKGTVWNVTLKEPAKKDYAQGTVVRQHRNFDTFIYCKKEPARTKWTKFEGTISGILNHGASDKQFWPGTKSVRILLMTLGGDKTTKVEFKNLKVEAIDVQ